MYIAHAFSTRSLNEGECRGKGDEAGGRGLESEDPDDVVFAMV